MLLRQVQARPLQGHHLRALWRRGHAFEGAPRAHGPHRAGRAGHAHLVLQGRPEPARLPARHRAEEPREGHLLRRAPHHVGRRRAPAQGPRRARGRHPRRDRRRREGARARDPQARRGVRDRARGARGPRREEERARAGREGAQQGLRRDPSSRRHRDRLPQDGLGHVPLAHAQAARRRRARVARAPRPLRGVLHRRHGCRGGQGPHLAHRHGGRGDVPQGNHHHVEGPAQGEGDQAPEGDLGVQPRERRRPQDQLADGHGPRRGAGDPARPAPDGAARRWPLRDVRPQRPLPPGDQPQQPAEAAPRPRRARDHHQQREADAAGGRRRAVRQRPPRSPGHRSRATAR